MTPHNHKCCSTFHQGPRIRNHFSEHCNEIYESACIPCQDQELAAAGATYEYFDESHSDADPGL